MPSVYINKLVGDFENRFKESLRGLKDCHNILSEHAADDDTIAALLGDLKSIVNSYKQELVDFHRLQSAISVTEEHFYKDGNIDDNFESLFKTYLKKTKENKSSADAIVDDIIDFSSANPNSNKNCNNESLICTQSTVNSIDPLTKKQISTPFKNKICSHVYEKDTILAYIKNKKKGAKCPYVGCTNSNMRQESLELDFALSLMIKQGACTSTQLQHSINSIAESSDEENIDENE